MVSKLFLVLAITLQNNNQHCVVYCRGPLQSLGNSNGGL